MKEMLKSLGITYDGAYSNSGSYVVDLMDSNSFGKVYTALDKNDDVEEITDTNLVTVDNVNISYLYDDYQLTLVADFENDDYRLIVTEFELVDDDEEDIIFDEDEEDEEEE